jgi:hypothetical protein
MKIGREGRDFSNLFQSQTFAAQREVQEYHDPTFVRSKGSAQPEPCEVSHAMRLTISLGDQPTAYRIEERSP